MIDKANPIAVGMYEQAVDNCFSQDHGSVRAALEYELCRVCVLKLMLDYADAVHE